MPRKSTTDNKIDNKAEIIESEETQIEETPLSEAAENDSENSDLKTIAIEISKRKLFNPKLIFAILILILVALLLIYLDNIQNLILAYESRFYVIGVLFIALIVSLLVWSVPKFQVKRLVKQSSEDKLSEFEREEKRLKLEDDTRKTLAQIIGGVFLIAGLFVTYNTYRLGVDNLGISLKQQDISLKQQEISIQKQDLDRRGQITERFNKAVEHLGNDNLSVRLGGLYALEQILKDSPEEHQTIIEVFSAYIREKSNSKTDNKELSNVTISRPKNTNQTDKKISVTIPTDVQTALTIIGRRPTGEDRIELEINLSYANLKKANFNETNFKRVNFSYADLNEANLKFADLTDADLSGADLSSADLTGVKLSGAKLSGAKLSDASLNFADMESANLSGANLSGAKSLRADFSGADLSEANLSFATFDRVDFSRAYLADITINNTYFLDVKNLKADQLGSINCEYFYIDEFTKLNCKSALKYFEDKENENQP